MSQPYFFHKATRLHFVGIGGTGMSGIAEILLSLGFEVSGSDLRQSDVTRRLEQRGANVAQGHDAENVGDADVLIYSSAVRPDNPEVLEAQRNRVPVIRRAEMLGELMRLKFSLAVAGSHGKTTTTAMLSTILTETGNDPTVVIGGRLKRLGGGARLGQSRYLVAEADESDGSFTSLHPSIAVVTNIDLEHLDYYQHLQEIQDHFLTFLGKLPFYGAAILNFDDEHIQELLPQIGRRFLTYGFLPSADVVGRNVELHATGSSFEASFRDDDLGTFHIPLLGRHNVQNAMGVLATAIELGIDIEAVREAFTKVESADRRFQFKGEVNGIQVFDDYGHHPTEIKVTLDTARHLNPKRLLVIFQPHRYSRTEGLWNDFCRSFYETDRLWVLPIYAASETPLPEITSEKLVEDMARHGQKHVEFAPDHEAAIGAVLAEAQPGDLIMTLGAGNVTEIGKILVDGLREVSS